MSMRGVNAVNVCSYKRRRLNDKLDHGSTVPSQAAYTEPSEELPIEELWCQSILIQDSNRSVSQSHIWVPPGVSTLGLNDAGPANLPKHNEDSVSSGLSSQHLREQEVVCFGALPDISLYHPNQDFSPNTSTIQVVPRGLDTHNAVISIETLAGSPIASLSERDTGILHQLATVKDLQFQWNIVQIVDLTRSSSRVKSKRNKPQVQASETLWLQVTLYGTMELYDVVGSYLLRCHVYIQLPTRCDRNVPYRNPQSLSGRDLSVPMTFQLRSVSSNSTITPIEQIYDPSETLQSSHSFREAEQPILVKTRLKTHQKQALTFMLNRERGWDLYGSDDDIWKAVETGSGRNIVYYNTIWQTVSNRPPEDFRGGILADSMGLGKTLTIIALLAADRFENDADRISPRKHSPSLIVVPSSLLQTWEDELHQHLHPGALKSIRYHGKGSRTDVGTLSSYDIVLTTYDVVASQWRKLPSLNEALTSITWRRVVLDEAHEIRHSSTNRAKAIFSLRSDIRWAVSGTPIQNKFQDLLSLLRYLRAFSESDVKTLLNNTDKHRMLAPLCLRRAISSIELPHRIDEIHTVEFGTAERLKYNRLKETTVGLLDSRAEDAQIGACTNVLTKINALRQICNLGTYYRKDQSVQSEDLSESQITAQHTLESIISESSAFCALCGKDMSVVENDDLEQTSSPEMPLIRITLCGTLFCEICNHMYKMSQHQLTCRCGNTHQCGSHEVLSLETALQTFDTTQTLTYPTKILALQCDLKSVPKADKSIIFSFWTSTLNLIGHALDDIQHSFVQVDGTMSSKERQRAIESFKDPEKNIRSILFSLRCGSTGLNLSVANHVFLMEPQWNPMIEDQAFARVHRLGQTKNVTTVRYIVNETLEEKIRMLQKDKRKLVERTFLTSSRSGNWKERLRNLLTDTCA